MTALRITVLGAGSVSLAVAATYARAGANVTLLARGATVQPLRQNGITEIDYLNGAIVRMGKGQGIATPYNEAVSSLVRARETGVTTSLQAGFREAFPLEPVLWLLKCNGLTATNLFSDPEENLSRGLFVYALPMNAIEGQASLQLAALAEVSGLLKKTGIDYWLFGGWAVDFYVGEISRAHDDIDLAVWLADVPEITALLLESGWQHAPSEDEDGGTGFQRGGVRLEFTYLVRNDDGLAAIPFHFGLVVWPGEDGLGHDVRELHGVQARLMGLAALLRGKSELRDDPEDAAKDRADFARLSRLLA